MVEQRQLSYIKQSTESKRHGKRGTDPHQPMEGGAIFGRMKRPSWRMNEMRSRKSSSGWPLVCKEEAMLSKAQEKIEALQNLPLILTNEGICFSSGPNRLFRRGDDE